MTKTNGTCQTHADVHAFNDDCIGWRDYPDAFQNKMRQALLLALVQRQMFCPVSRKVLDVRTCGYFVDADGDPAMVLDMSVYMSVLSQPLTLEKMAQKGYHPAPELPAPGVKMRGE